MIVRQLHVLIILTLVCFAASAQMIPPDVQVSLERIDPFSGKIVWSKQFDRKLRPYRCEAYTNGIVAYLSPLERGTQGVRSEVVFLDPATGASIKPFDTRDFIWPSDDPQIVRSRDGSQGSVEEERCEITLANGWRSHGVAGLSWRNAGSNHIYFFFGSELRWSMVLPDGAYNLSHWKNILIFNQYTKSRKRIIDTLYAQPVGRETPIWKFSLPNDIADRSMSGGDVITDETGRRFSYYVGRNQVFVYGGGTLFALDPETGRLLWRHTVTSDPIIKNVSRSLDAAEVLEADDGLLITSETTLIRFDPKVMRTVAVLRSNLNSWGPLPIYADRAIYCFTERP